MPHQHIRLDPAQIKTLAARQHRDRDFADFGGGEDEFGVLGRFFQRLQEGVEGRRRQHVDFVDDVDLVAGAGRRIAHAVIDLADVVDAGMGRGVHLQHVHVPAFHDRLAVHAEVRHVDGRSLHRAIRLFVVQRAGENSRRGGFADPADAGQDPGLRNPAGFERVRNGADHGLLADQIVKTGGAVFARQHPVRLCSPARRRARGHPRRLDCRGERQHHSSVDPQWFVSRGRLADRSEIKTHGADQPPPCAIRSKNR